MNINTLKSLLTPETLNQIIQEATAEAESIVDEELATYSIDESSLYTLKIVKQQHQPMLAAAAKIEKNLK